MKNTGTNNTDTKMTKHFFLLGIHLMACLFLVSAQVDITPYHVKWSEQSINSSGSMPIGNGDVGANVWVAKEGTLNLLISKTDAYSEIGRLLKIGKLEIKFSPNILDGKDFQQELVLEKGLLNVHVKAAGKTMKLSCWIDALAPTIHIEGESNFPVEVEVSNKIWRTRSRPLTGNERHSGYGVAFRNDPFMTEVDTVLAFDQAIGWCHENKSSIWEMTLDNQNIAEFRKHGTDPLIGQHFGAIVGGKGFMPKDPLTLSSTEPMRKFDLHVVVDKSKYVSVEGWKNGMTSKLDKSMSANHSNSKSKHTAWWSLFWNKHYIIIHSDSAKEKTFEITQAYMLQRYMNACAGRGALPIKFNGSIFTVDLHEDMGSGKKGFDADYREWGGNYWFQNTRLIYWPMLHSGDTEMMRPFFDLYLNALELGKFRTQKYFNHGGAYFPETMTPWGAYLIDNYGWDRQGKKDGMSDNLYIRYYWQNGLELSVMMVEYFEYTRDTAYFSAKMIPFIKEILKFYDQHYKRDNTGKLWISPAQSLETFQEGVINPTPEIAGLLFVIEQIMKHQSMFIDMNFINTCKKLQGELPPIPVLDTKGVKSIAAGSNLGERLNIENPELYAVFPYRIFGLDKPDLELARNTFNARPIKRSNCWHQDAIQAALLGHTAEAKSMVTRNFLTKHEGSRFPAFWGPGNDWVPDQDHGGVTSLALQYMLIQTEGNSSTLFPAWPSAWNVEFKLHTSGEGVIEGKYEKGKGVRIRISKKPQGLDLKIMIE
jgi:hypothetical protein